MSFFEVLSRKDETMFGKQNRKAFTLIELLVVVAIIALLVSIMVPAVQNAMNVAKDGVVGTQLHNIQVGLEMFKHDTVAGAGYYPPSDIVADSPDKSGAQLLCDFLMGLDLRGYDPLYDPVSGLGFDPDNPRRGPYIKLGTVEFEAYGGTYIMKCKWGSPILYYRAAPGTTLRDGIAVIYRARDNDQFIRDYTGRTGLDTDPLADSAPTPGYGQYGEFFEYITDPQLPGAPLPYNPDTFILVSAGRDGIYGNEDDVFNFEQRE